MNPAKLEQRKRYKYIQELKAKVEAGTATFLERNIYNMELKKLRKRKQS